MSQSTPDFNVQRILHIDSSGRYEESVSRQLSQYLVEGLLKQFPDATVIRRDLALGLPFVNEGMIDAYFTPSPKRTPRQHRLLAKSDSLIQELKSADMIVFGIPMYNLSVPAVVKAYIDLICRAGETFQYNDSDPEGLLLDRKTYMVVSSGSTVVESEHDFVSGYMRQIMNFMGIRDIEIIKAHRLVFSDEMNQDAAIQQIHQAIGNLRGKAVV